MSNKRVSERVKYERHSACLLASAYTEQFVLDNQTACKHGVVHIAEEPTMENTQIKVYVGRRSMSAGDDMNVPNMKTFYLPDTLEAFAAKLHKLLPFDTWTCYLGYYYESVSGEEDGILVAGKKNSSILILAAEGSDSGVCNIVKHAANWQDLIKEHPYLYCE